MPRIFVGVSEYGALRGVHQYAEERAGLQMLAVLAIVNPQLPAKERVTINEAQRPRASQTAFWNDMVRRGAPPAVVAARPFTSKHDGGPGDDQGRAFDLGGPGGSVISDRAHALVKAVGAEYGIHHTGAGFNPREKWHFEYVLGTARKLASTGPTRQEQQEEHMTARLYRHNVTGTIAIIDPTTGYYWGLPGPAYVDLVKALGIVPNEDARNIPPNQFEFLQGRAIEHRQQIAATVWTQPVAGWNGPQSAAARLAGADAGGLGEQALKDVTARVWGATIPGYNGDATAARRLAGIDEKAGTAKVDATGLTVKVDEASLVGKITDAVRGIFTKAGTK